MSPAQSGGSAPRPPARKKSTTKRTTRKRRGPAEPRGPEPGASVRGRDDAAVGAIAERIEKAKGAIIGAYRDPYAGEPVVVASLPLAAVEATPFQRDLSRTHAERLATAIGAAGLFLDPAIASPTRDGVWSPNGPLTLGAACERSDRFAGSSYHSMLRRVDRFLDATVPAALRQREQWAVRLLDIDDRVSAHVKAMQEAGMKSPYLRQVVVARCNPVR